MATAPNSASAGFLAPSAAAPYDDPLDDLLTEVVVGITGIAEDLVRPRWQPEPRPQPAYTVNWCAVGVVRSEVETFAYERHNPAGEGSSSVERTETLYVLHSFYGPNAHGLCERFRDGFEISQNRDTLRAANIGLVEVQQAIKLPALLKEKWVSRVDVTVVYVRRTARVYNILNLLSAQAILDNEVFTTPISTSGQP